MREVLTRITCDTCEATVIIAGGIGPAGQAAKLMGWVQEGPPELRRDRCPACAAAQRHEAFEAGERRRQQEARERLVMLGKVVADG